VTDSLGNQLIKFDDVLHTASKPTDLQMDDVVVATINTLNFDPDSDTSPMS